MQNVPNVNLIAMPKCVYSDLLSRTHFNEQFHNIIINLEVSILFHLLQRCWKRFFETFWRFDIPRNFLRKLLKVQKKFDSDIIFVRTMSFIMVSIVFEDAVKSVCSAKFCLKAIPSVFQLVTSLFNLIILKSFQFFIPFIGLRKNSFTIVLNI